MLKLLVTGLWVCIVTLGAVYLAAQASVPSQPVDDEAARKEAMQLVRGEALTIPVISNGMITGYFLGRFSFMMDKEMIRGVDLPVTEVATDQLFTLLVGEKMIDLGKPGNFDLDTFKARIRDGLNDNLGDGMVSEVLVEQLDFISKEAIRTNMARQGKHPIASTQIVEGTDIDGVKSENH